MEWNKLDYDFQMEILDKLSKLADKEKDPIVKEGIIAAIHELEIWSNSPTQEMIATYDDNSDISFTINKGHDDKPN